MGSIRPRSFSEYAQMLWRRKLLFLSIAGATMIAAYIIISRLPDSYESKAAIVVTGKTDERQAIADRVAAVRERLSSRQLLEAVAQRHGLATDQSASSLDTAINRLRKDTKVETFMRGDFPERLTLTYKNNNPQLAKEVATDLVSVFGNMNQALEKQMAEESEALNTELNDIENRLNQISQRRSFRRVSTGGGRPRIDLNAVRAERAAASSSIETLTDKQFSLEREIAQQKQQIAEQQKLVKAAPGEARSSSSYGVLLVRKAELEAQIKDFTAQYTDKNPKVIQARAQLDEINRQIAQLNTDNQGGTQNSAEARELRTLERELGRMETELAITNRALDRKRQALESTPEIPATVASAPTLPSPVVSAEAGEPAAIGDNAERLKNRYDSLLRRQERLQNVRFTAAGLDPGLFQIVDMPAAPEIPTGPDRLKLLGLALILALGLGLLAVISFEIPRLFAIQDDRDVEYYLGAPVIVLIPETLTPTEHGRAKRLLAMRVAGMVLLGALIIPVLIFLLNNLKVFQLLASR